MILYQCDICGEKDIIENADFVHIGDAVLCKRCYGKIVKSEALDEVLEIIDKEFGTTQPYCDAYGFIDFALKIKKIRMAVLELKEGDKDGKRK